MRISDRSSDVCSSDLLKLSYTQITAPINGVIGQKSVRVGAFVNAGKPLVAVIPLDAVYITANFRETQLARVRAGQSVDIKEIGRAQSELQSLMRISYAVFCLKKKTDNQTPKHMTEAKLQELR